MTSIVEEAGPDLFAWYRSRVPGLPAERDFLHVVSGRPMSQRTVWVTSIIKNDAALAARSRVRRTLHLEWH